MLLPPPAALARRQFLRRSLAGLVVVGGCGQIGGRSEQTSAAPASSSEPSTRVIPASTPTSTLASPRPGAEPAPELVCRATEPNIEGPFFRPGAPRCDAVEGSGHGVLASPYEVGTRVTIVGRVLDPECRPLPGARFEIWHADHDGAYDHEGFTHRGRLEAGPEGEYRLDTIIPGHYLNGDTYRPAHIHVKVHAPGRPVLTTQLYFEGDPYNEVDPFIRSSLVMALRSGPQGKRAAFDFVV